MSTDEIVNSLRLLSFLINMPKSERPIWFPALYARTYAKVQQAASLSTGFFDAQ